jgi:hypothetical protein
MLPRNKSGAPSGSPLFHVYPAQMGAANRQGNAAVRQMTQSPRLGIWLDRLDPEYLQKPEQLAGHTIRPNLPG